MILFLAATSYSIDGSMSVAQYLVVIQATGPAISPLGSAWQHRSTFATPKCNAQAHYSSLSDVPDLNLEIVQFLLDCSILLGHILIFLLPLITTCLESLDFAFIVTGLDVSLT